MFIPCKSTIVSIAVIVLAAFRPGPAAAATNPPREMGRSTDSAEASGPPLSFTVLGGRMSARLLERTYLNAGAPLSIATPSGKQHIFMRYQKFSELDWRISDARTLGGRLAWRPVPWLALRVEGRAVVDASADMQDRDWTLGYRGPDSWGLWSQALHVRVPRAWQGDVSAAARIIRRGGASVSVLAGFRLTDIAVKAFGARYDYSRMGAGAGVLPAGMLTVSYRQVWRAPYAGVEIGFDRNALQVKLGIIGSPFASTWSRDLHPNRPMLVTVRGASAPMIGVRLGAEYAVLPGVALTAMLERQHYFETRGRLRSSEPALAPGMGKNDAPTPPALGGASLDSLSVMFGVKARFS